MMRSEACGLLGGQEMDQGLIRLGDGSVERKRGWEEVVVRRCAAEFGDDEGDGLCRYMGTASVATDMLRIVEKLGEEKLHYWGFVSLFISLLLCHETQLNVFDNRATEASSVNTLPPCTPPRSAASSSTQSTT